MIFANFSYGDPIFDLYCNTVDPDSTPRLRSTKDCVAIFEWSTPSACKVTEDVIDADCKIKDPKTGHMIDFTSLGSKKAAEIENPISKEKYLLSLCGAAKDCCTKPPCKVAACKKSDQSERVMVTEKTLRVTESGYQIEYRATKENPITYIIDILCDRNSGHYEMTGPKSVDFSEDENVWTFEYKTALACTPMAGICSIYDNEFKDRFTYYHQYYIDNIILFFRIGKNGG